MRLLLYGGALALGACGPAQPAVFEPADPETAPAAELAESAVPSEAERVEALLAEYFSRLDGGGDADALFPPGAAPTIFDRYVPVTLVEHETGEALLEGAAGTIYASVPVRIVFVEDMTREEHRLEGDLVFRRVNDVPGASADQLRWRFHGFEPREE